MNGNERREELINVYAARHVDDQRENKKLRAQIAQLEEDNETLKKVVAMLMRRDVMVYRKQDIDSRPVPRFKLDENIGGEVIVRVEI